MGTLRTLFAIAVVLAHSYGEVFVGGRNAVQLFYMISGFLISYVLVEKKAYSTVSSFYFNRYLRLYPIYLVVALLTLLASVVALKMGDDVNLFKVYHNAPYEADTWLVFSNSTLFFQDWVMFAGVESGKLVFAADCFKSEVPLYRGLLVPQAWTLGIELSFYLIAPFVLHKRRLLLSLLALSISLRLCLIYGGVGMKDPWTYRFFPTELAIFLLGALAHQVLLPFYKKKFSNARLERYAVIATCVLVLITLFYWVTPIDALIKNTLLFLVFVFLMPMAFVFQALRAWDRWIGDLSYPIYICHMLVIYVAGFMLGKIGAKSAVTLGASAVVFSICFAMCLNRLVGSPVERIRNRFRVKKT